FVFGLNERAPAFILGRLSDVTAVAHFEAAHEMAVTVTTDLRAPVRRVLFPGFARLGPDPSKLTRGYVHSYGILVLVGLPIPVAMAVLAPLLVHVFLGDQWRPVVPVVQGLGIFGVIQALSPNSHLVYLALNRVRITAVLSVLRLAVLVPLLLWGVGHAAAVGA